MITTVVSYLKANYALTSIKTIKLVIYMDDAFVQFNEMLYRQSLTSTGDDQFDYAKIFSDTQSPLKISQSTMSTHPTVTKTQPFKPGTIRFDKIGEFVSIDYGDYLSRVSQSSVDPWSSWVNISDSSVAVHPKSPVLLVKIYAENLSRVKKTKERLQRIIDDQFTTDTLTDELIVKLSDEKKNAITRKAKQKHVGISIKTSVPLICIQLRGDRNDVADLKFEIQQELNNIRAFESLFREARLLQGKIKWWWWMSDVRQYKDFDCLTNYQIEQAYQTNRSSVFAVEANGFCVECNFMKMEANINKSVHMIRRVDLADLLNERKFIIHNCVH